MVYREYIFTLSAGEDYHKDLLIHSLAGLGFDTFEDHDKGFSAYISLDRLPVDDLEVLLNDFRESAGLSYEFKDIPPQNWNKVWESNFEPVLIRGECYIRATFHEPRPDYDHEIVVDPKMAFGTGHHQTTALMMEMMLDTDFRKKSVLDMGCGTGILSILASQLGAEEILAIDYDPACYESTVENAALNGVQNIIALCGSSELIPPRKYDIILANINRNILLDQMGKYAEVLLAGGLVFLSGFYEDPDLEAIRKSAGVAGLTYVFHQERDNWAAAKFHS